MRDFAIMIKPASSLCNLRCKYCFYTNISDLREVRSYGIMPEDTTDQLLQNVFSELQPGDHVTFAFQGGEPMLAGLSYFEHFVKAVMLRKASVHVHYAIQTNGTLIDHIWADFFFRNRFLVGISLDALKDHHDRNRLDTFGAGTYGKVMEAIRLLKEHHVDFNILTVLTDSLARHPQQVWSFLKKTEISHVQFIPCLAPLDGSLDPNALSPERFAGFYIQIFRLWLRDWNAGDYISIKLFDDVIHFLQDGIPGFCGMTGSCYPQLVVESDGGAYPCDFYVLDEYKLGNLTQDKFTELYASGKMLEFRNRPHHIPSACASCSYIRICRGGCKRMQGSMYCATGKDTCGYRMFLDQCLEDMGRIASQLRQR